MRTAADFGFPSAHPASLARQRLVAHHCPTVYVSLTLSVKMTAEACAGLRRIAAHINGTHQDAIRHILGTVRLPSDFVCQSSPRNDPDW